MATITEIVTKWIEDKKEEVRQSYDAKGLKASGRFGQSLQTDVKQDATQLKAVLTGANYGYFMQHGRGKTLAGGGGALPLRVLIRQWIDDKGIVPHDNIPKDSLAFLIARKIHEQGIKVPNAHNPGGVFSDVFTPQSLKDLAAAVGDSFLKSATSEILGKFK